MSKSFVIIECHTCQEEFSIPVRGYSWRKRKYCSNNCRFESLKGRKLTDSHKEAMRRGMIGKNVKKDKKLPSTCMFCEKQLAALNAVQCRDCFQQKNRGEAHYKWIKDRSLIKESDKKHLSPKYQIWSKAVKDRDKWCCRINDSDCSGRLEAHHILRWSKYPKLRYEVNNGITLCAAHHPRKIKDEENMAPLFRELVKTETT